MPLDLQSNALPTELFRQFTHFNSVAPLTIHMHVIRNFDTQNVHHSQYGDRTHDLGVISTTLYPTELTGHLLVSSIVEMHRASASAGT